MSDYVIVRDAAVAVARYALMIPSDELRETIERADHALAVGPILDPTLARNAADELQQQLVVLRAVRDLQRKLEPLRPAVVVAGQELWPDVDRDSKRAA